jgi:hypothetical protein
MLNENALQPRSRAERKRKWESIKLAGLQEAARQSAVASRSLADMLAHETEFDAAVQAARAYVNAAGAWLQKHAAQVVAWSPRVEEVARLYCQNVVARHQLLALAEQDAETTHAIACHEDHIDALVSELDLKLLPAARLPCLRRAWCTSKCEAAT